MKCFSAAIISISCFALLTSCSKSDEQSGSSKSGYQSVSNFKLPDQPDPAPYTPAPSWVPTPFDSKSGRVKPNDLATFMESLVVSGENSKKGEFETTSDYNKRIANIDAIFFPIKGSEIYAFSPNSYRLPYDADKQVFKSSSAPLCMDGYRFDKSVVSCDFGTVEAADRNGSRPAGLMKNVGTDYYLLFPHSKLKKYLHHYTYNLPDTCPIPASRAQYASKTLRIAYAFSISKAEVKHGDQRLVEPLSALKFYDAVGVYATPEYFICYDDINGEIYYQSKL